MGFLNDVNRAVYSAVPRKIELSKNIDIQDLNRILEEHSAEFETGFKFGSFPVKRITFKRHPKLEMQLILTVKDNVVKITPNLQEGSFGSDNFQIRTADLKNGFGFSTELNRDDYIENFTQRLTTMLKEAGY